MSKTSQGIEAGGLFYANTRFWIGESPCRGQSGRGDGCQQCRDFYARAYQGRRLVYNRLPTPPKDTHSSPGLEESPPSRDPWRPEELRYNLAHVSLSASFLIKRLPRSNTRLLLQQPSRSSQLGRAKRSRLPCLPAPLFPGPISCSSHSAL